MKESQDLQAIIKSIIELTKVVTLQAKAQDEILMMLAENIDTLTDVIFEMNKLLIKIIDEHNATIR